MIRRQPSWLVSSLAIVIYGLLAAARTSIAAELKWTHFGIRPLGMGNAFVAQSDDFNALYYNPAGLAWLKTWSLEILSTRLEISQNTLSAGSSVSEYLTSGAGDTESTIDLINEQGGKSIGGTLGLEPYFVMPGFGLGIAIDLPTKVTFHRDITFDVDTGPELLMPISFARSLYRDRLAVGFGVKARAKFGVERSFDINSLQAIQSKSDGEGGLSDYVVGGFGFGVDAGILFRPDPERRTTLGISILDIGDTAYSPAKLGQDTTGTPTKKLASVNAGVSFQPIRSDSHYVAINTDFVAINQPVHASKKVNLGAEYGLGEFLKVQGGVHQGEWTAGLQLAIPLLSIKFATYAAQLGTAAGQDELLSDRRYAMNINLLL